MSVILCTYNGAAYLQQQLDSIASQSLLPFEVIACDDGSTDATIDLLTAFRRRAPFEVKIVSNQVRLGSTANFDQAMQRATGKYLALCDQDDIWMPQKLATLVPLLESDPGLGAVFSDAKLLDSRGISGPEARVRTLWSMHGFNEGRQKEFSRRDGAIRQLLRADVVTGATLLIRASLRPLWHPIPRSWVHDGWITWILAVHARLQPVPEALMSYRLHGEQQLGTGSAGFLRDRVQRLREMERARYARVACQYEDLQERLQSVSPDHALEEELHGKISLLRRRAELSTSVIRRSIAILRDGPAYWRYARGWRSMRKDLFL